MKMPNKNGRIIRWICIIFILLVVGLLLMNLNYRKQMIIDINKQNLQILADEKALQVNNFLESQENTLSVLASLSVFRDVALDPNNPEKIKLAEDVIYELKDEIPGIGVLTKEGIVIVAGTNSPGTDYSFMPQFPVKDNDTIQFTRYYDLERKKDYYAIGGPIYDSANSSRVIGVITFDIELDKVSLLMKETVESKNREVYLIDENGLLLSDSEYIDKGNKNGILIQEVKSDGAKLCLDDMKKYGRDGYVEKHEEEVGKYLNYMGNEVFGAHAYVPIIHGCVLAEEDVKEISHFTLTGHISNIFKKEVKNEG